MDRGAWLVRTAPTGSGRGFLRFQYVSGSLPCCRCLGYALRAPPRARPRSAPARLAEEAACELGAQFGDVLVEGHKNLLSFDDRTRRPGRAGAGRGSPQATGGAGERGSRNAKRSAAFWGNRSSSRRARPAWYTGKAEAIQAPGRFARRDGAVCRPFGAGSLTRWLSIAGEPIATESVDLKRRLFEAHGARERPLCLCRRPGVPMYVARVDGAVILKRMPLTGPHHDPTCDSYEPPPELSGRGEVLGAIAEDADDSAIRLRLDFSLSKRRGRSTPSTDEPPDAARTDGSKLSLRALLHYLWEEAELNCWSQGMAGKRNWAVVRHRLAMAVAHKLVKGVPLARKLFIPETFAADRKAEIADRRRLELAALVADGRTQPLMLLVGEVKEIGQARFGVKLVIKHLPEMPLMLGDDVHRRLKSRFAAELALADTVAGARLIAVATFGRGAAGVPSIEEIALVAVTEQWIPIENAFEAELVDTLVVSGTRFIKTLRYNLKKTRPLASAVLPATRPQPTALFILPPDAEEGFTSALQELVETSALQAWIWHACAGMPPLPAVRS